MKDFHFTANRNNVGDTVFDCFPNANYYADGRQALIDLYHSCEWKRLWIPAYFCYDVIASLQDAGLVIMPYLDWPEHHDCSKTLEYIQREGLFRPTDAILLVNYFGMRAFRSPKLLPVAAIVEDHTHDLIGDWAMNSQADWCIASLRKTLPVPEGGILWSPVGHRLPHAPNRSKENERIAAIRWEAMKLKASYLAGEEIEKDSFRARYVDTEEYFDRAPISSLDIGSHEYLKAFNVRDWYNRKYENWRLLRGLQKNDVRVLIPEGIGCFPFSLTLLFDTPLERDRIRKELIAHRIYPAILWNVPDSADRDVADFSRRMLSIHCDGRYNAEDMQQMKSIIEYIL